MEEKLELGSQLVPRRSKSRYDLRHPRRPPITQHPGACKCQILAGLDALQRVVYGTLLQALHAASTSTFNLSTHSLSTSLQHVQFSVRG